MISLLIPTINRSDFIVKYLKYLNENQFEGQVLIGDSSNQNHYDATKNFIKNITCDFEIIQYSHPNMYPHMCIQKMLNDVRCPYSLYINDDDILVVKTLMKCVNFLEANPDYSAVGGQAIACDIKVDDYSIINSTWNYRIYEIINETAIERINNHLKNYSVLHFSLSRTKDFKKLWPIDERLYDKAIGAEILPCTVLAAQGKVKMLNDLLVVRQIHERRIILPMIFDTILQPHWSSSTIYAIEYLSKLAAEIDSISFDKTYPIVKNAWENYLILDIICKYHDLLKDKTSIWQIHKFRSFFKTIPWLKKTVLKVRSLNKRIVDRQDKISLSSLLKTTSPYYKDFMPVYDAITKKNEN